MIQIRVIEKLCVYVYIYIYIYTYVENLADALAVSSLTAVGIILL